MKNTPSATNDSTSKEQSPMSRQKVQELQEHWRNELSGKNSKPSLGVVKGLLQIAKKLIGKSQQEKG